MDTIIRLTNHINVIKYKQAKRFNTTFKDLYKVAGLSALITMTAACTKRIVTVDEKGNTLKVEEVFGPKPVTRDTMIVLGANFETGVNGNGIYKSLKLADKAGLEYFYQTSQYKPMYIEAENVLIVEKHGNKIKGIQRNLTHEKIKQEFGR